MNDPSSDSLKDLLVHWATEHQRALLAQVTQTLQQAPVPDEALLGRIVAALPAPEPPAQRAQPDATEELDLGRGLDTLEKAATQGEVLKRLLDGLAPFAERCALFVVKQGIASLYAHRGFEAEAPKGGSPVVPPPELENLMSGATHLIQKPGPAYTAVLAPLSRYEATDLKIIPLSLRQKTVAILLVDSGLSDTITHPACVRALTYVAEARLSHLAAPREAREAKPEPSPSTLTQMIPDPIQESSIPALDPKIRTNAERSARVLVGDIELYFPAKLAQGQQQGNLYVVMRDELERSRQSFVERYGAELESQHQIFYQTVVQQLCGGDPNRLGPAPWVER